jgi:hypothetical protein
MTLSPLKFTLSLVCLRLTLICLLTITALTLIGTFVRSDCKPIPSLNIPAVIYRDACSTPERISNVLLRNASFLQSLHTVIFQVFVAASLIVFQPALRALMWSSLETDDTSRALSLASLNNHIQLSASPGLFPGVADVWISRRLTRNAAVVIFLSVLSVVIPIAISPIYHMRTGSMQGGSIEMSVGGGVDLPTTAVWDPAARTPEGVTAGRALLHSAAIMNQKLTSFSYSPTVIPFLDITQIPKIAKATIQTVVAYQSVDCGASAPARFAPAGTPGQLVSVTATNPNTSFWDTVTQQGTVSVGGNAIGKITNDPHVSAFYLGATNTTAPGWVNATSSVVFLAANGTLEGAQQSIVAPQGSNTRITNIDVLACTSAISLGVSKCDVADGHVTICVPLPADELPVDTSSSKGGIEDFISSPISTSTILSASPVTAYFSYLDFIPTYLDITPAHIAGSLVPLSYLSMFTVAQPYTIPQSYVTSALFSETSAGLVEGMVVANQPKYNQTLPVDLVVVFATSHTGLQATLIVIVMGCAIITSSGSLRNKACKIPELDITRILAISRDPQLDDVFAPFADRTVDVPTTVQELRVCYEYVSGIERRALSLRGVDDEKVVGFRQEAQVNGQKDSDASSLWFLGNRGD